jgi:hypothetical protein
MQFYVLLQCGVNIIIPFTVCVGAFTLCRHVVGPKERFFAQGTVDFQHETSPGEKFSSK